MKAAVYTKYGPPEVLRLKEVPKPVPKENEVLINVHAVSLNSSDLEFLTAKPAYIRMFGPFKPKYKILGSDIAGVVEAIGSKVTRFSTGEAVFGDSFANGLGGLAEYVTIPESALIPVPNGMTFEEASAIPQASTVALQGLRDKGQIKSGDQVLINGAGGGSGSFAIQIAKMYGAQVTGVDNAGKLDFMRSIGADHAIDYREEDFTKNKGRYDLILDFVAHHSIFDCRRALSKYGNYILVGGSVPSILQTLALGSLLSQLGNKKMGMLLHRQNNKDLRFVVELIEAGKINVIIDKTYPFEQTTEALQYLMEGKVKGKVVVSLKNEAPIPKNE
ncbi:NAD(P)-dependent alcohol dehydrogenase [Flavobacteriaceae bacterium TP-CH-4]|uniref:NAD(P)-dependent alcohol dehydrogenase n=1 Tax=Pelagihabitans pacificus TaxID=2696054 RepID=A0A967E5R0_9FLAO|nr:NAD(P)-dependent alcohol dehydrogenase [Pelagihabitans pacificus]NHF59687.1 NAD(P)-dependent alcohol dehydrogenase [Pelagihabitans pacificus]